MLSCLPLPCGPQRSWRSPSLVAQLASARSGSHEVPKASLLGSILGGGKPREIALLDNFAKFRNEGDFTSCAALLAPDIKWTTLYDDRIEGRAEVLTFMETERQAGRRNVDQGVWARGSRPNTFQRDMKVLFASKATHDVVQTVTVLNGLIQAVVVKPKHAALGVALAFAHARSTHDDEGALAHMSEKVEWKAWDGFTVQGKEGVRELFRQMKGREVLRQGRSEFEAAAVTEQGGAFERLLDIERVDGIKVRTHQRIFVRSELGPLPPLRLADGSVKPVWGIAPKIVEVHVLTTEELVDGKWVKSQEDDHW